MCANCGIIGAWADPRISDLGAYTHPRPVSELRKARVLLHVRYTPRGPHMPDDEDYTRAAICEAVKNEVQYDVIWCAVIEAKDGKSFDGNIQAAIHAAEWLDRAVVTYGLRR